MGGYMDRGSYRRWVMVNGDGSLGPVKVSSQVPGEGWLLLEGEHKNLRNKKEWAVIDGELFHKVNVRLSVSSPVMRADGNATSSVMLIFNQEEFDSTPWLQEIEDVQVMVNGEVVEIAPGSPLQLGPTKTPGDYLVKMVDKRFYASVESRKIEVVPTEEV